MEMLPKDVSFPYCQLLFIFLQAEMDTFNKLISFYFFVTVDIQYSGVQPS